MVRKARVVELDVFHHGCVASTLTEKFPEVTMVSTSSVQLLRQGGQLTGYQVVVEITASDEAELDAFLAALKAFKSVKEVEVWAKKLQKAFVFLRVESSTSSYEAIVKKGAMYFDAIKMAKGYDIHSIITTDFSNLKSLLSGLEEIGELKIKKIGAINPAIKKDLLTEKQVDALRKAISFNYYSWPRQATLEFLAKQSNLSRRAYQERLRKAEAKLFPELLKEFLLMRKAA